MRFFALLTLLVLVTPAVRADEKPNTITPKESADGWLLLFDGETSFGWHVDGDVKAARGELILGGVKSTKLKPPLSSFELRAEFRLLQGWSAADLKIETEKKSEGAESKLPTPQVGKDSVWNSLALTVKFDPSLGHNVSHMTTKSQGTIHLPDESSSVFSFQTQVTHGGGDRVSIFELPAGKQIALRNVKLRPLNLKPLFNGTDLTGWKAFKGDKYKSVFGVSPEGWLTIKNGPGDLQTESQWADFVIQLDCRTNGKYLNSGVFFRCRPDEYQQGYEAQIQNNFAVDPPKEYTVEVYDPVTHELTEKQKVKSSSADYGTGAIYRRIPARRGVAQDNEWFTMTVVARGPLISTFVDGIQVVDWTDNRPLKDNARNGCRLQKGHISLQGHDPTTDLSFRNIRIVELPADHFSATKP